MNVYSFLERMYVKEKVVIITGGSSGMGKGMATRFAKEGARVVITGRTKEKLEETKLEIEQFPGQVLPVQMDVRNTDDIQKMIEQIDEKFGRIDVLINNANWKLYLSSRRFICEWLEFSH